MKTVAALASLLLSSLASAAPPDDAAARMTRGAIPSEQLRPLAPITLGGVKRSHDPDYPWAVAAVYTVAAGVYYNLDIQNTFHRGKNGDDSLEKDLYEHCAQKVTVGGFPACLRTKPGWAALKWYLPDRLTVSLAADTEETVRKLARELPLDKLARLSSGK